MRRHSELPLSGFVTPTWVKDRYSISNSTLYSWIAKGLFPAPVRIGPRATRFEAESLRRYEAGLTSTDLTGA